MLKAVQFFVLEGGSEPVREWIRDECSKDDRKQVGEDIRYIQEQYPQVGLPLWRALRGGLYEIRIKLSGKRIARISVCFSDDQLILLHAFIKKTQKTPAGDLAIARDRMKAVKGK